MSIGSNTRQELNTGTEFVLRNTFGSCQPRRPSAPPLQQQPPPQTKPFCRNRCEVFASRLAALSTSSFLERARAEIWLAEHYELPRWLTERLDALRGITSTHDDDPDPTDQWEAEQACAREAYASAARRQRLHRPPGEDPPIQPSSFRVEWNLILPADYPPPVHPRTQNATGPSSSLQGPVGRDQSISPVERLPSPVWRL
ncbi:hypothetical protein DPSP01_002865 [Paraphaeosphaeria sporulosa]|uniref:Uncharacterized protein n=1 Tax=Paraphaeosphaeria sporulosa TaxID=1460663 RepID=A0A177CHY9_9PLEO|nr:uncharacterized protein CC84DRAFT_1217683 [Paraphaeosphaeria sporulosa]OAG06469.1 hypothetical protein CC84DRAFT_1217683 [Paraphaeosphaeria sporulosa]